jgi:multisubunit Na+/H+ antiporter MnhC subunit
MKIIGLLLVAGSFVFLGLFLTAVRMLPIPITMIIGIVIFVSGIVLMLVPSRSRAKGSAQAVPETDNKEAEITLHNEDPDDK